MNWSSHQQCLLLEPNLMTFGSSLQFLVKLAFLFGSFLILFPLLLRVIDAVDNSFAFTFIAVGILFLIIGELNRARMEDLSPLT